MKQENRSEIIHDALNLLDDEMIEEVEKLRGGVVMDKTPATEVEENETQKKDVQKDFHPWRKWVALAASVCILIVIGGVWNASIGKGTFYQEGENLAMDDVTGGLEGNQQNSNLSYGSDLECEGEYKPVGEVPEAENTQEEVLEGENGAKVTIPAMEVSLGKEDGVEADMVGFFIYDGRCYVQTCDYMTKDVVGDYVCTSIGFIDEWTSKDEYVELAGSIEAKFYEVKGVNPEFMLCTIFEDGTVETYIHNNGITLDKGSELLVDRLGLDENYKQVSYLTGEDWNNQYKTKQKPTVISEEDRELFDKFIASFSEGDFVYTKSLGMNRDVVYGSDAIYHLYITTKEGVPLHFLLLGNGYVSFYGLNQVCVQIEEGIFNDVINLFKER